MGDLVNILTQAGMIILVIIIFIVLKIIFNFITGHDKDKSDLY